MLTSCLQAENICLSVAGYRNLKSISLALVVGLGRRDGKLFTNACGEHVFLDARKRFLELLLHIRSTEMMAFTLRLAPFLDRLEDGSWQFTYRSSRLEAIDILFGSATRELLTAWPLETLKVLYIHIQDSSPDHDARWWHQVISDRLSDVSCAITVHVDLCRYIPLSWWTVDA